MKEDIIELDADNFDKVANGSDGLLVVEFYTNSCPNCKNMEPVIRTLAKEMSGRIDFGRINAESQQSLAVSFGIRSVPTFKLLCRKRPIGEVVGAVNKTILRNTIIDFAAHRQMCVQGSTPLTYEMSGYA